MYSLETLLIAVWMAATLGMCLGFFLCGALANARARTMHPEDYRNGNYVAAEVLGEQLVKTAQANGGTLRVVDRTEAYHARQ